MRPEGEPKLGLFRRSNFIISLVNLVLMTQALCNLFRFASDQTRPQFENPKWAITTITANDAVLDFIMIPRKCALGIARYIKVVRASFVRGIQ